MESFKRAPVTVAVFAGLAFLLSGCIAYDAASAVVGAGSTVVGAGASVGGGAGDIVLSPFDSDDSKSKASK